MNMKTQLTWSSYGKVPSPKRWSHLSSQISFKLEICNNRLRLVYINIKSCLGLHNDRYFTHKTFAHTSLSCLWVPALWPEILNLFQSICRTKLLGFLKCRPKRLKSEHDRVVRLLFRVSWVLWFTGPWTTWPNRVWGGKLNGSFRARYQNPNNNKRSALSYHEEGCSLVSLLGLWKIWRIKGSPNTQASNTSTKPSIRAKMNTGEKGWGEGSPLCSFPLPIL